jgi:hypothetical protein
MFYLCDNGIERLPDNLWLPYPEPIGQTHKKDAQQKPPFILKKVFIQVSKVLHNRKKEDGRKKTKTMDATKRFRRNTKLTRNTPASNPFYRKGELSRGALIKRLE